MNAPARRLALDVGGANLKAAHSAGGAASVPFRLWERPHDLAAEVARLAARFPDCELVALTMTAELCDCFRTKREGVLHVLAGVEAALPGRPLQTWGVDGRFHDPEDVRARPLVAAAANWLALATVAARLVAPASGLLVDVGSTTTDLIPFGGGAVRVTARDDTGRLASGELVYAGAGRTPVCALASNLPLRGVDTGLAAELFATTKDVYLTLGLVAEAPDDRETADGRPATRGAARDRLARMVGADSESFDGADALAFARAADEALLARLSGAARAAARRAPDVVVVAGSGEFLARRLTYRAFGGDVRVVSLGEIWGAVASEAACAQALLSLAAGETDDQAGGG